MDPIALKDRCQKFFEKVQADEKRKQIRELEAESTHVDFWQDHQTAAKKMKELSKLQKEIEDAEYLQLLVEENQFAEAAKMLDELEVLLYEVQPAAVE